MPDAPDNTIPNDAFALRLRIAALLRYRTLTAFLTEVQARTGISRAGFFKHWGGNGRPRSNILAAYADMLGVSSEWLTKGNGERIDRLQQAFAAVEKGDRDHAALARIVLSMASDRRADVPVNQDIQHFDTKPSIGAQIRHIPILARDQIDRFLDDGSDAIRMPDETPTIELPPWLQAGERAFAFRMPHDDNSMIGPGEHSFPAGTVCWIDADKPIIPGDFCLARPENGAWTIRRYKAAFPLGQVPSFTLEAINPSFEPVRVNAGQGWRIAGRVIFYGKIL